MQIPFRTSYRIVFLALGILALSPAFAGTLYMSVAEGPGTSRFIGEVNRNQNTASASFSDTAGIPQSISTSWSASANLQAGTLRATNVASNNGLDPTIQHADSTAIAWFADTFTYNPLFSGPTFTVSVSLDGSFLSNVTQQAVVINSSYLEFYFLKPGSLDSANIADSANVIASGLYGIGPNFQDNPYFSYGTINGTVSLPGTVSFSVPSSEVVGTQFQLLVLLQTYIVASTGTSGTFDYAMNLGNTAHVSLVVDPGAQIESAGGLPITTATATPEPSTWAFVGLGIVGGILRRR